MKAGLSEFWAALIEVRFNLNVKLQLQYVSEKKQMNAKKLLQEVTL